MSNPSSNYTKLDNPRRDALALRGGAALPRELSSEAAAPFTTRIASTWKESSGFLGQRITPVGPLTARLPDRRPLRVILVGTRGFPDAQGAVEKHTEKLAVALTKLGCEVEAVVRSDYVPKGTTMWRNVKIVRLWNSRLKGVDTFVHTLFGVLYAAWRRPDILHIHNIGPALFLPLARVLGLRVVVTYHSQNYEHPRWGSFARTLLRVGDRFGMAFSQGRIAVSKVLPRRMIGRYGAWVDQIPNGIDKPLIVQTTTLLEAFGLAPKRYALTVARIDEANRLLDLIAAYARIKEPKFKLALVGEADYLSEYARGVAEAAHGTPGVVLLGRQTGNALAELHTHAGFFVSPSSHEGPPITALEAARYGLPAILSDIPAHREIAVSGTRFFPVGDIASLEQHLTLFFATPAPSRSSADNRLRLVAEHDWDDIARRTLAVYFSAFPGKQLGALLSRRTVESGPDC
jgi:glycosyltransferase involved in cell wall biosynthesis